MPIEPKSMTIRPDTTFREIQNNFGSASSSASKGDEVRFTGEKGLYTSDKTSLASLKSAVGLREQATLREGKRDAGAEKIKEAIKMECGSALGTKVLEKLNAKGMTLSSIRVSEFPTIRSAIDEVLTEAFATKTAKPGTDAWALPKGPVPQLKPTSQLNASSGSAPSSAAPQVASTQVDQAGHSDEFASLDEIESYLRGGTDRIVDIDRLARAINSEHSSGNLSGQAMMLLYDREKIDLNDGLKLADLPALRKAIADTLQRDQSTMRSHPTLQKVSSPKPSLSREADAVLQDGRFPDMFGQPIKPAQLRTLTAFFEKHSKVLSSDQFLDHVSNRNEANASVIGSATAISVLGRIESNRQISSVDHYELEQVLDRPGYEKGLGEKFTLKDSGKISDEKLDKLTQAVHDRFFAKESKVGLDLNDRQRAKLDGFAGKTGDERIAVLKSVWADAMEGKTIPRGPIESALKAVP